LPKQKRPYVFGSITIKGTVSTAPKQTSVTIAVS